MTIDPISLAITVALDAASMALSASKKIQGPRVADLNATVADYGTPLNYIYGVRRVAGACFYCEPIKETTHHTKTKGGKYTEYRYFGTFAIIVADHHIHAYARIWFDDHLVYDASGSGEEITDPNDNSTLSDFMRQYLGDQTEPDPRMYAYIADKEGPNLTPGYLDISYLMFEALPLEFLGNRFPQVSVEVCGIEGVTAPPEDIQLSDFPITIQVSAPSPYPDCYPFATLGSPDYGMLAHWSFNFIAETIADGEAHQCLGAGNWSSNGQYGDASASCAVGSATVNMVLVPAAGMWTFIFTASEPMGLIAPSSSYKLEVNYQSGPCMLPFDPNTATGGGAGTTGDALTISGHGSGFSSYPLSYATIIVPFNQFGGSGGYGPPPSSGGDDCSITLGEICTDVITRAGIDPADVDFSALDQRIHGFSWTIADCKSIIAPLLDIYDSDIFSHDFGLVGRKRGDDVDDALVIEAAYLVRAQRADSSNQPLYQIINEAESDLPRRVFATYADYTADQQPNTAVAQRQIASTATTREIPIDIRNLALSPDEAQPLAERWLRRQWIGATTYLYTAAPWEIGLECANLRISDLDGEQFQGRLTRMVIRADRSIGTEWVVDRAVAVPSD